MSLRYDQGSYQATILRQGFSETKYGWQFVLAIQPVANGDCPERTVYLALTNADGDKAEYADKTIAVLQHLGFRGSEADVARLDPKHSSHHSFVGQVVEAYCKHAENDTGRFERWYINTPRPGTELKTPDPTTLRNLQTLFGKELAGSGGATPAKTKPRPAMPRTAEEILASKNNELSQLDDMPY